MSNNNIATTSILSAPLRVEQTFGSKLSQSGTGRRVLSGSPKKLLLLKELKPLPPLPAEAGVASTSSPRLPIVRPKLPRLFTNLKPALRQAEVSSPLSPKVSGFESLTVGDTNERDLNIQTRLSYHSKDKLTPLIYKLTLTEEVINFHKTGQDIKLFNETRTRIDKARLENKVPQDLKHIKFIRTGFVVRCPPWQTSLGAELGWKFVPIPGAEEMKSEMDAIGKSVLQKRIEEIDGTERESLESLFDLQKPETRTQPVDASTATDADMTDAGFHADDLEDTEPHNRNRYTSDIPEVLSDSDSSSSDEDNEIHEDSLGSARAFDTNGDFFFGIEEIYVKGLVIRRSNFATAANGQMPLGLYWMGGIKSFKISNQGMTVTWLTFRDIKTVMIDIVSREIYVISIDCDDHVFSAQNRNHLLRMALDLEPMQILTSCCQGLNRRYGVQTIIGKYSQNFADFMENNIPISIPEPRVLTPEPTSLPPHIRVPAINVVPPTEEQERRADWRPTRIPQVIAVPPTGEPVRREHWITRPLRDPPTDLGMGGSMLRAQEASLRLQEAIDADLSSDEEEDVDENARDCGKGIGGGDGTDERKNQEYRPRYQNDFSLYSSPGTSSSLPPIFSPGHQLSESSMLTSAKKDKGKGKQIEGATSTAQSPSRPAYPSAASRDIGGDYFTPQGKKTKTDSRIPSSYCEPALYYYTEHPSDIVRRVQINDLVVIMRTKAEKTAGGGEYDVFNGPFKVIALNDGYDHFPIIPSSYSYSLLQPDASGGAVASEAESLYGPLRQENFTLHEWDMMLTSVVKLLFPSDSWASSWVTISKLRLVFPEFTFPRDKIGSIHIPAVDYDTSQHKTFLELEHLRFDALMDIGEEVNFTYEGISGVNAAGAASNLYYFPLEPCIYIFTIFSPLSFRYSIDKWANCRLRAKRLRLWVHNSRAFKSGKFTENGTDKWVTRLRARYPDLCEPFHISTEYLVHWGGYPEDDDQFEADSPHIPAECKGLFDKTIDPYRDMEDDHVSAAMVVKKSDLKRAKRMLCERRKATMVGNATRDNTTASASEQVAESESHIRPVRDQEQAISCVGGSGNGSVPPPAVSHAEGSGTSGSIWIMDSTASLSARKNVIPKMLSYTISNPFHPRTPPSRRQSIPRYAHDNMGQSIPGASGSILNVRGGVTPNLFSRYMLNDESNPPLDTSKKLEGKRKRPVSDEEEQEGCEVDNLRTSVPRPRADFLRRDMKYGAGSTDTTMDKGDPNQLDGLDMMSMPLSKAAIAVDDKEVLVGQKSAKRPSQKKGKQDNRKGKREAEMTAVAVSKNMSTKVKKTTSRLKAKPPLVGFQSIQLRVEAQHNMEDEVDQAGDVLNDTVGGHQNQLSDIPSVEMQRGMRGVGGSRDVEMGNASGDKGQGRGTGTEGNRRRLSSRLKPKERRKKSKQQRVQEEEEDDALWGVN